MDVIDVLVFLGSDDKGDCIINDHTYGPFNGKGFSQMFELPSFVRRSNGHNWCEYLMWDRYEDSDYPEKLVKKYSKPDQREKILC